MRRSSHSNRNILLWVLSLIIVASMVCGLVISILASRPARQTTPAPTATVAIELPTPTLTATLAGPQPSPQPLTTTAP